MNESKKIIIFEKVIFLIVTASVYFALAPL